LILVIPVLVFARAGGGHTYSGDSSSSGGGGGVSPELAYLIFRLVFGIFRGLFWVTVHHPYIGIPLDIAFFYLLYHIFNRTNLNVLVSHARDLQAPIDARSPASLGARSMNVGQALERLRREVDPNFSYALFMDFVYSLFAEVHRARASSLLKRYSGYLNEEVMQSFAPESQGLKSVSGIVIGECAIDMVSGFQDEFLNIGLTFEVCYTETNQAGQAQSWYANERWIFVRKRGIQSKEPKALAAIGCPACGAPLDQYDGRRCKSCSNIIEGGEFDWCVIKRRSHREARPPLLAQNVIERGTELPTIMDPDLKEHRYALEKSYSDFDWGRFQARVALVFGEVQKAWTERKWENARPFLSDRVFHSHVYWIQEYRRQRLINVLQNVKITSINPVKVVQDKFFSSITVRIYASMLDYTQSEQGALISGDKTKPRVFSEYWTFIRGVVASPSKGGDRNCPNCGAALKINVAGNCEFCTTRITSGNFDWVLSRIEQDESYGG